ncbi:hypothetical protein F7661_07120 [Pseudomonas sp. CFA]|nr:hypothetical protein F7661_07120 [Pseudomonas sp. CFA]
MARLTRWALCRFCRPLRGHARSRRYSTGFSAGEQPVGAGVPTKRGRHRQKISYWTNGPHGQSARCG